MPVWKPFLKRRETSARYRMRPVPVVFLRLAFSLQLSVSRAWVSLLALRAGVVCGQGNVHFLVLAAG